MKPYASAISRIAQVDRPRQLKVKQAGEGGVVVRTFGNVGHRSNLVAMSRARRELRRRGYDVATYKREVGTSLTTLYKPDYWLMVTR